MSDVIPARPWLRFYSQGVPRTLDIPDVPLPQLLDDAAKKFGRHPAGIYFGRRISYAKLKQEADLFAGGLAALGVRRGDRVAIILPNCPQFPIAWFATLRIGAIAVPFNPLYTADEMGHQLRDSGAKVAIAFDQTYKRIAEVRESTRLHHVVLTSLTEYFPRRLRFALKLPVDRAREGRARLMADVPADAPVLGWRDVFERAAAPKVSTHVDPNDVAALLYTGGTTGRPKGAMLTHRNLVSNAHQVAAWDPGIKEGKETGIGVLPAFHAYGLTLGLSATMLIGATVVLVPTFDLKLLLQYTQRLHPTLFPGVPPIYSQLLEAGRDAIKPFSDLRACISGAMRLPPEMVDEFESATGCRLVEGYGLTEASPVVTCNPISINARTGTVGIPLPNTDVKVVDEHTGDREVPPGVAGELIVNGPQIFAGYWNEPEDTARMLRGGWLYTGDIAVMSPDGYVTIIDRKRDVIISSGFSVFPSEIEDVLATHPAVGEAAVIGIPDPYRGEAVKAYLILKPDATVTEHEVVRHCSEHLAAYKVPRQVEFRTDLPRNIIGKVLRRVLRDEHEARAAGSGAAGASFGGYGAGGVFGDPYGDKRIDG